MNQENQLLSQLFSEEETRSLGRDVISIFGYSLITKLKDALSDDFLELVVALQNKEPGKARELLKTKNIDINKIINDVTESLSNDLAKNLSESLDKNPNEF